MGGDQARETEAGVSHLGPVGCGQNIGFYSVLKIVSRMINDQITLHGLILGTVETEILMQK